MARVLVVAGTASGVGKTTVTLGLLEAWRRRGLVVQAFKVGPDFIDPGFHELVTGRPSYNLDGWMCGCDHVRATVARHAVGVDVVVVVGGIPHDPALELPERHLGLVTAIEGVLTAEVRECLATTIERTVDLDRLLAVASPLSSGGFAAAIEGGRYRKAGEAPLRARIGVAHDAAFQFYYRENFDLLRAA